MPIDYTKYSPTWHTLSRFIRDRRAQGQCECQSECGLHRTHPGPRRCIERNGEPAQYARGRIVLTVAHLCHDTTCTDISHLRAMCQRCHLRYDALYHKANAARTRLRVLESHGQQRLFPSEERSV